MIGLRDHLISPFLTGYEGTAIDSLLDKARANPAPPSDVSGRSP